MNPTHSILQRKLSKFRSVTFGIAPQHRVHDSEGALQYVNKRGFIFFWPVQGITLPSLWTAHAGDIPVANEHDHPGHHTWGWKDNALGKRIWYYGKILRRKATFLSLAVAPFFYAISPNYGNPGEDYQEQYEAGNLSLESKLIFETLFQEGPLNTLDLRKLSRLSQRKADYLFTKNIDILQAEMKIMPVGIAEAGAWKYSYIYDLTHRHLPTLVLDAEKISESDARKTLIMLFMQSVGCATRSDVTRLFQWQSEITDRTVSSLVKDNILVDHIMCGSVANCLAIPELVE